MYQPGPPLVGVWRTRWWKLDGVPYVDVYLHTGLASLLISETNDGVAIHES